MEEATTTWNYLSLSVWGGIESMGYLVSGPSYDWGRGLLFLPLVSISLHFLQFRLM